jgi:hypothetical protein
MAVVKPTPVQREDLVLKPGRGHALHDRLRGKYWHIWWGNTRVGKVYIDFLLNPVLGMHPAIDVFINQQYHGRRIGRYAYAMACEVSGLSQVYMHTRKSNMASRRAAAEAGFVELQNTAFRQVVMVWNRPATL